MIAIISDIHSNLEAFRAVLEDIMNRDITRIICLGDLVGYGPNPREVLELSMDFETTIVGNHDDAVVRQPKRFNMRALMAIEWTKKQLNSNVPPETSRRWLNFLDKLPDRANLTVGESEMLLVHGSPRDPIGEYVFPRDILHTGKLQDIFSRFDRICLIGHSHVPGVYTEDIAFHHPDELPQSVYVFDGRKTLINVGSVGQPRDGNPKAGYVTLTDEGDAVVFRRVPYDYEQTRRRIHETPELDNTLGDRLVEGV